ncbi:hypothetical protein OIU74_013333 [Salix koriyanagi]|uniref:Uncharacterized protein n=1 Tax=Salix koriyanagi TaxID=2511006 RepID=A0A9Q0Q961_9ROSI|nr:hypothetical protein OIU74_013333 [Salix koriyanagi]
MKSSLSKLRGLAGFHKHGHGGDHKNRRNLLSLAQFDELAEAYRDMQDMKDCYDSLLSAASATANCAYVSLALAFDRYSTRTVRISPSSCLFS